MTATLVELAVLVDLVDLAQLVELVELVDLACRACRTCRACNACRYSSLNDVAAVREKNPSRRDHLQQNGRRVLNNTRILSYKHKVGLQGKSVNFFLLKKKKKYFFVPCGKIGWPYLGN